MLSNKRFKAAVCVVVLAQLFFASLAHAQTDAKPAPPIPVVKPAAPAQDDATISIFAKRRYSAESVKEELAQSDVAFACAFMIQDEAKTTGRKRSPHTRSAASVDTVAGPGTSGFFALGIPSGGPAGPGASATGVPGSVNDGSIQGQVNSGGCEAMLDDPRFNQLVQDKSLKAAYAAYEAKDYATALPLFEEAYDKLSVVTPSNQGIMPIYTLRSLAPVAVIVGRMYFLGQGTAHDSQKAIEWLEKAALTQYSPPGMRDPHYNDITYMSSQAEAAITLAGIYQTGAGVPVSPVDARKWYMRAAELDYFPAVHICGLIFQSGYGGERNVRTAVAYFTRAGTTGPKGYAPSQYALGEIYYYGDDHILQDKTRAGAWLLKAAKNGYPDALYAVGRMYELGEGGASIDPAKAVVYYKEAAVKGQPDAEEAIGLAFYTGNGVPKDLVSARQWFLKASEDANPDAMFNLAVMMVNGEGGPKSLVQAYCWFYIADKGGVEKAGAALQELATKMTPDERAQADALLNPKAKS
jgi:TPR repeat protein